MEPNQPSSTMELNTTFTPKQIVKWGESWGWIYGLNLPLNNDCIGILFLSYEYSYAFAYLILLKNLFDKYHIRKVLDVFGYMCVFSILL